MSAGAYGSAQLLMLSGIGPKQELLKHDIHCRADLPVGQDLMDHSYVATVAFLKEPCQPYDGSFLDATGFYKSDWSKKHEPQRGRDMQVAFYISPPPEIFLAKAASDLVAKAVPVAPRNTLRGKVHIFLTRMLSAILINTHILVGAFCFVARLLC